MSNNNDILFQVIDWQWEDVESDDGDETVYKVYIYGRTKDRRSIFVEVDEFPPHFYVRIPPYWKKSHGCEFVEELSRRSCKQFKGSITRQAIVDRHIFFKFNNYQKFNFLRVEFSSYDAMKQYRRILYAPIYNARLNRKNKIRYQVYEDNIDPHIRMMHIRDLQACGWIKIKAKKYTHLSQSTSYCPQNISTRWTQLEPVEDNDISPFVIAAFDIECDSADGHSFPQAHKDGDTVTQIGTTYNYFGESDCFKRHILTLGSCDPIEGATVESFETERDLLLAWTKLIQTSDPDIITGWNVFGFDFAYLQKRSKKLGCQHRFAQFDRNKMSISEFVEQDLESSALGSNKLAYYKMKGRVVLDLMKVVQKDHKLAMYSLDFVSTHFIRGKVTKIEPRKKKKNRYYLHTSTTYGLKKLQYIVLEYFNGIIEDWYGGPSKFQIEKIYDDKILIKGKIDHEFLGKFTKIFWCQAKDDVKPKEIFAMQHGDSTDRARIARYCIQDCVLCNKLMSKLQIVTNNIGMANVCNVPLSYLFLRGQGVKIFSLVSKRCRERGFLVPRLAKRKKKEDDESGEKKKVGYQGAYVLDPTRGIHYEPITVLDYASLYPSSMIEKNMSHETYVEVNSEYDNLPDQEYYDIMYDRKDEDEDGNPTTIKEHHRFVKPKDGRIGIIPEILGDLLGARKATKKKMAIETDAFKKSVLNGLQLAYKVVANSVYGQCGADISPISFKVIAACTTARGRELLNLAKDESSKNIPGTITVYGDTDSVFLKFPIFNKDGSRRTDREARVISIKMGQEISAKINEKLPYPHNLEYEKTYHPMILLEPKKYSGLLYEFDPDSYYRCDMGIELKRRDNAPVTKLACAGIVNYLLNERNPIKAVEFTQEVIKDILKGKYPMEKFIITKTLKDAASYKAIHSITHAWLAERMGRRDPGSKPRANDRIPYVYVEKTESELKQIEKDNLDGKILQGDMVDHVTYVKENNLKIDYLFYITNQIKKVAVRFLQHVIKDPEGLFDDYIMRELNRRKGVKPVGYYFGKDKSKNILDLNIGDSDEEEVVIIRKGKKQKNMFAKDNTYKPKKRLKRRKNWNMFMHETFSDSDVSSDDDIVPEKIFTKRKVISKNTKTKSKPKKARKKLIIDDNYVVDGDGIHVEF
jgi:DNA polymerase elongation subunit (family B)